MPADVSIVGFDAVPESEFFTPPLTTIRQDFVAIGRRGFEALRRRIEDGEITATHQVLESELLVGPSTGPPPAGR